MLSPVICISIIYIREMNSISYKKRFMDIFIRKAIT